MILYSTSKGIIKVGDLRQSSLSDNSAMTFEEDLSGVKKNFFTEIVASVSDAIYTTDGKNILSRDFLNVKVWDLRKQTKPTTIIPLFDPLKSKLCELYENEAIFDKFNLASSPCSNYFITGMFNSNFHVVDKAGDKNFQFELTFSKKNLIKKLPKNYYEQLGADYDFDKKVLNCCWHPKKNIIAVSCLNCLFFYNA